MKARYNSINDYLKNRFGERIYKVILESGCGCPNRDGTLSTQGCIFCNELSSNPTMDDDIRLSDLPIAEQLRRGIAYVKNRHGVSKFISYLQSGSNTYGPLQGLTRIYNDAIDHPDVVGLAVSTRPDCLSSAMLDVLEGFSRRIMLWVELGLQSAHDDVLERIGRSHTVGQFSNACSQLQRRSIPVCAHIIIGLPGETRTHLIETARFLNEHNVWGVKIHNLHVLKDTKLATLYDEGKIGLLTLKRYAELVVDFLEHLSPDIVIHRLNSHSPRSITVAPHWSINKLAIFNEVEAELQRRDSWQGKQI